MGVGIIPAMVLDLNRTSLGTPPQILVVSNLQKPKSKQSIVQSKICTVLIIEHTKIHHNINSQVDLQIFPLPRNFIEGLSTYKSLYKIQDIQYKKYHMQMSQTLKWQVLSVLRFSLQKIIFGILKLLLLRRNSRGIIFIYTR